MNDIKLLDHVVGDISENIHDLERNILGQVFISWVLEPRNVDALELPCWRGLMRQVHQPTAN